jgi:ABC-2 type transport system ATP-binding protein
MQALNALECIHVSHSYSGRLALDDVSFAVPPGQFAVLLGRNGAGKTTLFSLVTRLYHARTGDIRVLGTDVRAQPQRALAAMGIVFQQLTIDLELTIRENLNYHGALYGLSRQERKMRLGEEIERIGLADRMDERVRNLSGGLRRRAEIARALLHRPRLLLLDEPTAGLDIAMRRTILAHLLALCRERGTAVLWTTHLIEEAEAADLAIILHEGRVLQVGPPAEVLRSAAAQSSADTFVTMTAKAN